MSISKSEILTLVEDFLKGYPRDEKKKLWKLQSSIFKEIWKNIIMNPEYKLRPYLKGVAEEGEICPDLDPLIRLFDKKGKKDPELKRKLSEEEIKLLGNNFDIKNDKIYVKLPGITEIEGVVEVQRAMTQNQWRRCLAAIKEDVIISSKIDKLLNSTNEDESAQLLDDIQEAGGHEPFRLGGEEFIPLNILIFINDPEKHISVVSLKNRLQIIKFFELNKDNIKIEGYMDGRENILAEKVIMNFNSIYGTNMNLRELSEFFYDKKVKEKWRNEKVNTTNTSVIRYTKPMKCPNPNCILGGLTNSNARFSVDESNLTTCKSCGEKFKVKEEDIDAKDKMEESDDEEYYMF